MLYTILFSFSAVAFAPTFNIRQTAMLETLNDIHTLYMQHYAPLSWKNKQNPNFIDERFRSIIIAIESEPEMSKDRFRQYLFDFIHSTRDYHVQMEFFSTESSLLPFTIRSEEGRLFITHIESEVKDDPVYKGIELGDEIVRWDNQSAIDAFNEIVQMTPSNSPGTDRRIAEMRMTTRFKSRRMKTPVGDVVLVFKKSKFKDDEASRFFTRALTWKHIPEFVPQELPVFDSLFHLISEKIQKDSKNYFATGLMGEVAFRNEVYRSAQSEVSENPYQLGGHDSFVPELGQIIWKNHTENPFKSYIYRNENGHLIGYLRIPNYMFCSREEVEAFDENIAQLESKTDGLVIDQVANPGGRLYFSYAVISRLINKPVSVLPHQIVLSEMDAFRAFQQLNDIEKLSNGLSYNAMINMEDSCGMETGPNFLYGLKEYNLFLLNQLNKGRHLSEPVSPDGVANLNPHSGVRYTKPILMLIEHLDVSAADMVPAILQDSQSLTLFGTSTSGAGGMVRSFEPPNQFGISSVSFTTSQAIRKDGKLLENLGVTPDIAYEITAKDLQDNYQDYKSAINKAISHLVDTASQ